MELNIKSVTRDLKDATILHIHYIYMTLVLGGILFVHAIYDSFIFYLHLKSTTIWYYF